MKITEQMVKAGIAAFLDCEVIYPHDDVVKAVYTAMKKEQGMDLISLLVAVLILGLVFSVIYWAIGQISMPAPFRSVAIGIMALIVVLLLLGMLFGSVSIPSFRIR